MDAHPDYVQRYRILGKMLSQYLGQHVIVVGNITKVSANSDCVEITTTDNLKINVSLPKPFEGNPEGLLEVWGIAKSKTTMQAETYVHFEENNCKNFDAKSYNDLMVVLQATQNQRWVMCEDQAAL